MTIAKALVNSLRGMLPQNSHAQNTTRIETKLQKLKIALDEKAGQTYLRYQSEVYGSLFSEKETYGRIVRTLNGNYFEDPASPLKQAWDTLVEKVALATGDPVTLRSNLEHLFEELDHHPSRSEAVFRKAIASIQRYLALETKRDDSQTHVNKIQAMQNTGSVAQNLLAALKSEKELVQARLKELCGDHYEDPTSLLDISWKKYQHSLTGHSPDAGQLLDAFGTLDTERKTLSARLYSLDQQLSQTPSREYTIETLTIERIKGRMAQLEGQKNTESQLAGIDWKKTAAAAASFALRSTGQLSSYR